MEPRRSGALWRMALMAPIFPGRRTHTIYADILGANARIVQVAASTGAETILLKLNKTERFNLTTAHDAVFCPDPNGTLILSWPSPSNEIYAFKVSGM